MQAANNWLDSTNTPSSKKWGFNSLRFRPYILVTMPWFSQLIVLRVWLQQDQQNQPWEHPKRCRPNEPHTKSQDFEANRFAKSNWDTVSTWQSSVCVYMWILKLKPCTLGLCLDNIPTPQKWIDASVLLFTPNQFTAWLTRRSVHAEKWEIYYIILLLSTKNID